MHVTYSTRLTWVVVIGGVFWLALMLITHDERLPDARMEIDGAIRRVWPGPASLTTKRWLAVIVLLGALLRVVPITFGLPLDRARPDEEVAIGRALGMVGGDLNPHFFDWGSLTFYLFAGSFSAAGWIHDHVAPSGPLTASDYYMSPAPS